MKTLAVSVPLLVCLAAAQTQPSKSFVGTLMGIRPESAEIEIKPDSGAAVSAKLTPGTVTQRIAPGEKDLKNAKPIPITDLAMGDRVLVTLDPAGKDVRRIVLMSANEIARRNAADRADWTRRGISGIVASKKGNEITLKMRSLTGEVQAAVTLGEKTSFKRYAPDSVKFTDARSSNVDEVAVGDQLRARGQKSADGLKVEAEEVVFGTFITKAGTITAVNPESHELTIKDITNNKPVTVRFTDDSQLKRMPDMAAMMGGMRGGMAAAPGTVAGRGGPGGGAPSAPGVAPSSAGAPDGAAAGRGASGSAAPGSAAPGPGRGPAMGGPPGGGPGRGPAGMDIAQLLETLPPTKLEDLKTGDTILVSSTKGARTDQITAIMLLGNADALLQIVARSAAAAGGPPPSLAGLAGSMPSIGQ